MRSTDLAIISSYSTSMSGIVQCFIKYQTLDKNISNFIFYRLEFSAILREIFRDKNLYFQYLNKLQDIYGIYTVS